MPHVVSIPAAPFAIADGRLEVHQVLAASDNLCWLVVDPKTRDALVVDGPSAKEVLAYCGAEGLRISGILNTHTHHDHIGINLALQKTGQLDGLRVVGNGQRAAEIPGLNEPVGEGDVITVGGATAQVWLTEGHIDGHLSFVFDGAVFCGDTMFGAGCGYLFDGPPAKMEASLKRLASLPDDTRVCCAHEYTEDNLRFAWSVEPDNLELAKRIQRDFATRRAGGCTVPSTIADERQTNPFVRTASQSMRTRVSKALELPAFTSESSSAEVFAATRRLKDRKDYRSIINAELPLTAL